MQKTFFLFFALLITLPCFAASHKNLSTNSKQKFSLLFIGNSLTYTNDLPNLVKENAKSRGIKISTQTIAFPNYSIEDHWNNGNVQKLISSKKYDFAIVQQGPSSQDDGRQMLIDYGKKYSELCKLNQVKLCYFMVWPALNYYASFDAVIKNHTDAATMNDAILLPVGTVWKNYIDSTSNKEYYGVDGFHPSLKGSQAAAHVIVECLFK